MTNRTMNTPVFTSTRPNRPVNTMISRMPGTMPPMNCQGRNRPHRVFVLSTRLPSSGSRKISAMRMTTTSPVITAMRRLASVLSTSMNSAVVTNVMKNVLIVL